MSWSRLSWKHTHSRRFRNKWQTRPLSFGFPQNVMPAQGVLILTFNKQGEPRSPKSAFYFLELAAFCLSLSLCFTHTHSVILREWPLRRRRARCPDGKLARWESGSRLAGFLNQTRPRDELAERVFIVFADTMYAHRLTYCCGCWE
jgi:hypothetical protein